MCAVSTVCKWNPVAFWVYCLSVLGFYSAKQVSSPPWIFQPLVDFADLKWCRHLVESFTLSGEFPMLSHPLETCVSGYVYTCTPVKDIINYLHLSGPNLCSTLDRTCVGCNQGRTRMPSKWLALRCHPAWARRLPCTERLHPQGNQILKSKQERINGIIFF